MIHNGGAYGGHYFAYIKSFEDGKWYNFNDSSVSEIADLDQLFRTFGGDSGKSDTAYMLMYRKVTGKEQPYKFSGDLIPSYLRTEIDEETEKLIAE
jgi:ubiquitin carboxyl-terminal hydrolase 47